MITKRYYHELRKKQVIPYKHAISASAMDMTYAKLIKSLARRTGMDITISVPSRIILYNNEEFKNILLNDDTVGHLFVQPLDGIIRRLERIEAHLFNTEVKTEEDADAVS